MKFNFNSLALLDHKNVDNIGSVINTAFVATIMAITIIFTVNLVSSRDSIYHFFGEQIKHLTEIREEALSTAISYNVDTMTFVGKQIIREIAEKQSSHHGNTDLAAGYTKSDVRYINELLREVDMQSDSLTGIAIISPQTGKVITSSGQSIGHLPAGFVQLNIRDKMGPVAWTKALDGKPMVGRTYYQPELKEWIIPVRIMISYKGKLLLIASGISVADTLKNIVYDFAEPELIGNVSYFVREDKFIQFSTNKQMTNEELYLTKHNKINIDKVRHDEFTAFTCSVTDVPVYGIIHSNTKFDFTTIVTLPQTSLQNAYWKRNISTVIIYISVLLMAIIIWFIIRQIIHRHFEILILQANYDLLTGLPNRAKVNNELTKRLKYAKDTNTAMGLFFIDLDDFKYVNDTFSHLVGDELLKVVGSRFKSILRKDDIVARLGGDEFVVITSDRGDRRRSEMDVYTIAEQLHYSTKTAIKLEDGVVLYANSSIGVAIYPMHAATETTLLRAADLAMYTSKKNGKNQFTVYNNDIAHASAVDFKLRQTLRRDIIDNKCNNFSLVYQPQVASSSIVGLEVLVRWNNADFDDTGPAAFIPIIEDMNLIDVLGTWVFETALSEWQEFRDEHCAPGGKLENYKSIKLSVNMSTLQFQRRTHVHYIKDILQQHNMLPSELVIEITETAIIDETLENMAIGELARFGIGVSIDDFGTGYSSLKKLGSMPFNSIKIDKVFVDAIDNDIKGESLIHTMILLANKLGVDIVAEGVETHEQLVYLETHCPAIIIQGYLFSKPIPIGNIIDLVNDNGNIYPKIDE